MAHFPNRAYFAWEVIEAAESEDTRSEDTRNFQKKYQEDMRIQMNPFKNLSEQKFVKIYRLRMDAVEYLCDLLNRHTELKSSQRVTLESKVLCALLFFAHGDYQRVVGEANHFSQEAMSSYIEQVTNALNHPYIINKFIKFPKTLQERDTIKQRFNNKYRIPGVIGSIDGCHFKIFTPRKDLEHLYYCRKHYHSLNVQMVCDADCKILSVNAKFGGATHDAFIWDNSILNSYMQRLYRNNELVWLLGDSGYPLRPWLMTPYSNVTPGTIEDNYNKMHGTARVVIENTFGRLKNRWRCVSKDRTLHYEPVKCAKIIIACCILHNLALEYNVPDPEDEPFSFQEPFQRQEILCDNETSRDLLVGRTVRDQLARRLAD